MHRGSFGFTCSSLLTAKLAIIVVTHLSISSSYMNEILYIYMYTIHISQIFVTMHLECGCFRHDCYCCMIYFVDNYSLVVGNYFLVAESSVAVVGFDFDSSYCHHLSPIGSTHRIENCYYQKNKEFFGLDRNVGRFFGFIN